MNDLDTLTCQNTTASFANYFLAKCGTEANETSMLIFALFIGFITLLRLWLAWRQIRYVSVHKQAVPDIFVNKISLDAHQKAADYACAKARFSMIDHIISAGFLLWLTLGGGFNWMVTYFFTSETYSLFFITLILFACIFVISTVISLVVDYYRVFILEEKFGFNRSTLKLWLADQLRGILLSLIIEFPLILLAVFFIDRFIESWWLWLWLVLIGFNLLMSAAYPKFIAPLFNKFIPLNDPELYGKTKKLLNDNQFTIDKIYVMDGSRRSSHGNAYFTGFGSAKRIVFFDTLLQTLSHDEIIAVLAHELGHLKRRHIWKMFIAFALLAFVFFFVLYELSTMPLFYSALNIYWPLIPVMLLLFMQLLPFVLFPLKPILSLLSRKNEYEADAFAAQQVPAECLISGLVKLFGENASTLTPDPIYSMVYDSHPSAMDRIARLEKLKSQ